MGLRGRVRTSLIRKIKSDSAQDGNEPIKKYISERKFRYRKKILLEGI